MYQTIHEKILVWGVYRQAQFAPQKFVWRLASYPVDKITLVSDLKEGLVKKRIYSLISRGNMYRLSFNRETEIWFLEEIWCE